MDRSASTLRVELSAADQTPAELNSICRGKNEMQGNPYLRLPCYSASAGLWSAG